MDNSRTNSIVLATIIMIFFAFIGMYLGYQIASGIFVPVMFAALFAVVFYPLFQHLLKRTKSEAISSLLCCLTLIISVIAVISLVVYLAVGQVVSITKVFFTESFDIQNIEIFTDQAQLEALVDQTIASVDNLLQQVPFIDTTFAYEVIVDALKNIPPLLQGLSSYILSIIRVGFDSAARGILDLVIFFISFYYLLIDGKRFVQYSYRLLPINALHERQISKRFSNLCYAWIVVNLMLAFIQGTLAAIGFAIIGVPSPLIWGIVTMLASFIPFVGSAIIWGIIALIYLILGQWGSALFIVIWGGLFISSSDNILRPFLLKEGIKIHPLIVFLSVLGGFFAFNVPGLVIGPLIMVFISTLLYIYELEFGSMLQSFHASGRKK